MKAEELKTKTYDELTKLVMDMKKKQFNLRFQKSQGQVNNTAQIRGLRRDIARAKTFMTALRHAEEQKDNAASKKIEKAPAAKKKEPAKKADAKKAPAKKTTTKKTTAKATKKN
jgi:large subunit ribosomal protein L29